MSARDPRPSEDHVRRAHELYAILYSALREVARRHGYALAVHGSLERDIDLVAMPWTEAALSASTLADAIYTACDDIVGHVTGPCGWTEMETWAPPAGSLPNPTAKPHGRLAWSILLGGGQYIDLSVMPRVQVPAPAPAPAPAPEGTAS